MSTDLTKMVEEWFRYTGHEESPRLRFLFSPLKAMAAEIEANMEDIKELKAELKYCQRIKPRGAPKGVNQ